MGWYLVKGYTGGFLCAISHLNKTAQGTGRTLGKERESIKHSYTQLHTITTTNDRITEIQHDSYVYTFMYLHTASGNMKGITDPA